MLQEKYMLRIFVRIKSEGFCPVYKNYDTTNKLNFYSCLEAEQEIHSAYKYLKHWHFDIFNLSNEKVFLFNLELGMEEVFFNLEH